MNHYIIICGFDFDFLVTQEQLSELRNLVTLAITEFFAHSFSFLSIPFLVLCSFCTKSQQVESVKRCYVAKICHGIFVTVILDSSSTIISSFSNKNDAVILNLDYCEDSLLRFSFLSLSLQQLLMKGNEGTI